jgi:hypothetical protein
LSRWEEVDEAEEKAAVPSMPISKWLAQEEAVRQQVGAGGQQDGTEGCFRFVQWIRHAGRDALWGVHLLITHQNMSGHSISSS